MRRILVTGANKGIGLAIVKKLLVVCPDSHLYLGSRDVQRGERAVQEVVEELGEEVSGRLDLIQLDVCSDLSVEAAVARLKTKLGEGGRLYGLVNNAGGILSDARQTIQLNTYGPIRVCQAFMPLLQPDKGETIKFKYQRPETTALLSRPNCSDFLSCGAELCVQLREGDSGFFGQS